MKGSILVQGEKITIEKCTLTKLKNVYSRITETFSSKFGTNLS